MSNNFSLEVWSTEDEAVYAPLRRKKLRIDAKVRRDKTRKRPYLARKVNSV
jgi:hypothetical protein